MKILQVHNFYQIYGGECAVVAAEKKLLEEEGHHVIQFTKDSRDIDRLSLPARAAMLYRIPWNRKAGREIIAYAKKTRPDVAHVHNIFPLLSPAIYTALSSTGIPIVQTHHNFRALCPNGLFFTGGNVCEECGNGFSHCYIKKCMKNSRLVSYLYAKAIAGAWEKKVFTRDITRHIALNRFFAEKLTVRGIPADRIRICGNFVSEFVEQAQPRDSFFLFLGRLSREKGLFTLLEAAKKTKKKIRIAGTGPLENRIKQYLSQHYLPHVKLIGFVGGRQKAALLNKCLALIIPSRCYDNFPISALEAQAAGSPVIASRTGGLPEIVVEGETGFLFQPGSAGELASLLERLGDDPRLAQRLAEQAALHARLRFGPRKHLASLEEIYREAISAK